MVVYLLTFFLFSIYLIQIKERRGTFHLRKKILTNVLSTLTFTGMLFGIVVTPAMASNADFYDNLTKTTIVTRLITWI